MAEKAKYEIKNGKVVKTTRVEFDLNNVVDKLKLYLELSDMAPEQLAKEFALTHQSVYNWLNGRTVPRASFAERINNRLDEVLDVLEIKPEHQPILPYEKKTTLCKECKHAYKHKLSNGVSVLYCNHMTQCDATCMWSEEIR